MAYTQNGDGTTAKTTVKEAIYLINERQDDWYANGSCFDEECRLSDLTAAELIVAATAWKANAGKGERPAFMKGVQ